MKNQKGQTLVILLFFVLVAMTYAVAAVGLMVSGALTGSQLERGFETLDVAESGAEDAILQILRDPAYAGGTFNLGDGSVSVNVAGTNPKTVTVVGTSGNFVRKINLSVLDTGDVLRVVSWKEEF